MPIFEYACKECGQQFEQLVARAKADAVTCKHCGSKQTTRRLSTFGVGAAPTKAAASPCGAGGCGYPSASPCAGGMCNMMN